jgi:hypothetical protein
VVRIDPRPSQHFDANPVAQELESQSFAAKRPLANAVDWVDIADHLAPIGSLARVVARTGDLDGYLRAVVGGGLRVGYGGGGHHVGVAIGVDGGGCCRCRVAAIVGIAVARAHSLRFGLGIRACTTRRQSQTSSRD